MASTDRWIRIRFGGDSRQLKQAAGDGEKSLAGVTSGLGKMVPAAAGAGKATDRLGDQMDDATRAARRLDQQIDEATGSLRALAVQQALTGGDNTLVKQMRAQERELRKLTRSRKLIGGDSGPQDLLPDPSVGLAVGAKIGPFLVRGLSGAMAGVGPAAAIGAPIVVGLAAFLGGATAGALLAGAVVGGVGGGLALAARDSRVKAAGKDLGNEVLAQMTEAAKPFVPAALEGVTIVRGELAKMDGDLRGTFAAAARYVAPLTRGLTGLVRSALPGIRRGIESATPVVRALERSLPGVGRAISSVFDKLADNADVAAVAIEYMFKIIEGGIRLVGGTIDVLATTFGWIDKAAAAMNGNYAQIHKYNQAADEADQTTNGLTAELMRLATADPGTEALWQRQTLLNKSMSDGVRAAGGFGEALDLLNGKTLGAREAERAFQAAIDAVTTSINENGKSLSANTEKGRANQEALDALATAGATRAQSIYEQTLATKGQTAAEAAASAAMEQGRAQLIASAQRFGMTRKEAIAYANSVMAIPRQWSTKITVVGHRESIDRANAVQAAVQRLTGKTIRIGVVGSHSGHLEGMSTGGRVGGTGIGDTQVRALDPEEHVLTRAEVRAAGGHPAIEQWRRGLRRRQYLDEPMPGRSGGGAAPARAGAPVHVANEVTVLLDGRPVADTATRVAGRIVDRQRWRDRGARDGAGVR